MEEIFDPLRKKHVALTPEENVRQQFIRWLNEKRQWPLHLMMSEAEISLGNVHLRCDIVCYANTTNTEGNRMLHPKMIVECKRPSVKINAKVFEQRWQYALILKVEYIVVTNGIQTFACRYENINKKYSFIKDVPFYNLCTTPTARQSNKESEPKSSTKHQENKTKQTD